MVKVFIEKQNRHLETDFSGSVANLAESVGVNIETVVCILNGTLVHESTECKNEDDVKFLSVISGG